MVWRRRKAFAGGVAEYASVRLFVCVRMIRICVEGAVRVTCLHGEELTEEV